MRTTAQLIADVRRQIMLPATATLGLEDADLLSAADVEMQSRILPLILSVNSEYNVQTIDVGIVNGQAQYRMPLRAAGSKLRDIRYIIGATMMSLPLINIEEVQNWNTLATGPAQGFYMQAASVNIVPVPSVGVLRMRYYAQHKQFVLWDGVDSSVASVITSPTYSTTVTPNDTLTLQTSGAFVPVAGQKYDIISAAQPYEHLTLSTPCTADPLAGPYTLLAPSVASTRACVSLSPNITEGDLIVPAGQSPVVQLPDEVYQLLVTRTCIQLLVQVGDLERAAGLETIFKRQSEDFLKMFSPRSDGTPHKMTGYYQTIAQRPWYGFWSR